VPLLLVSVLAAAVGVSEAGASASHGADTSYGRVDGDLGLVVGAGVTLGPRAPRAAFDARLRYLETVGIFFTYEDGFGGPAEPTRVLAFGTEVRPLFLPKWLYGLETGNAWVDLAIDSIGFEIGGSALQPIGGNLGERFALQLGGSVELPIFGRASGLWLGFHGGVRWSDVALAREAPTALERGGYLQITLSWHQIFGAHVVDLGDARPR
jgi:hypothetical protein